MKGHSPRRVSKGLRKGKHFPNPRVSIDYPWKLLAALGSDLECFLKTQDLERFNTILRTRDLLGLFQLAKVWGLQSINLIHWEFTDEISAKYQLSALLKRFPFETEKSAREDKASKKFVEAEEDCWKFNHVEWKNLANPLSDDVISIFTYARGFINRVLGDMPDFDLVTMRSRHGPGATLSTIGGSNSVYSKYADWPYDVTKDAADYVCHLIKCDERWLGALEDSYRDVMEIPKHHILDQGLFWSSIINIVDGNRVTFVPKDAQTERTIAIEPTINLMLQLGVDGFIRKRLKKFSINLDDQSKNQELARLGSRDGNYATLDLKAASDTVSLKLCQLMLPPMWYRYLHDLRSPSGEFKGEIVHYEKISSMGNGYTFALESLLFGSIIYGVLKHYKGTVSSADFSVFGDDLIIKTEFADLLVFYLRRFGFRINSDKTFIQGPVRESCGADWFRGRPIRPVFISEYPSNVKLLFSARNRLRAKLEQQWDITDSYVVRIIDKWVPEKLLSFIGPPSLDDFDSYRHMSYPYGLRYRYGRYKFKRITYTPTAFPGRKFLFRKLMANLRGAEPALQFANKNDFTQIAGLGGGGSCFTVTRRSRVIMNVGSSLVSYWPETYLA